MTLSGGAAQGGLHAFGHDVLNQLLSADHPATQPFNPDEAFAFDAVGNWMNSGEIHDLANRLLENATHVFDWDPDGNMTLSLA